MLLVDKSALRQFFLDGSLDPTQDCSKTHCSKCANLRARKPRLVASEMVQSIVYPRIVKSSAVLHPIRQSLAYFGLPLSTPFAGSVISLSAVLFALFRGTNTFVGTKVVRILHKVVVVIVIVAGSTLETFPLPLALALSFAHATVLVFLAFLLSLALAFARRPGSW
jgi:hypothetical protein